MHFNYHHPVLPELSPYPPSSFPKIEKTRIPTERTPETRSKPLWDCNLITEAALSTLPPEESRTNDNLPYFTVQQFQPSSTHHASPVTFTHGIHFPNGDVYKGTLQNGKMNGIGTLSLAKLPVYYHGNFTNGKVNGLGELFLNTGRKIFEGTFKGGRILHGTLFRTNDQLFITNHGS